MVPPVTVTFTVYVPGLGAWIVIVVEAFSPLPTDSDSGLNVTVGPEGLMSAEKWTVPVKPFRLPMSTFDV